MYLLDTDHISALQRGGESARRLALRLAEDPSQEVAVTIVSYEEQTRGWLAYIARATTVQEQVAALRRLRQHLEDYCAVPLIDFDMKAAQIFQQLQTARVRIGTMDLKIAAIALANDAILLTRNASDFRRVPGLRIEDWTT